MSTIGSTSQSSHPHRGGIDWNAPQQILDAAAAEIRRELASGDAEFALRIALDALKRLQSLKPQHLAQPPSTGDVRYDTFLAAGARMATSRTTGWGRKLPEPWYPGAESRRMSDAYMALTRKRTPQTFAEYNIFFKDGSLGSS